MLEREFLPGQRLEGSPYRIIRLVGAGGMGAVYEVEHEQLGKRYIAKTLLARLRSRDDLVARMNLEAKTLAKISHPNIVDVHHLDVTTDGVPYFIMEKLSGIDLRRLLRTRRTLDVDTAIGIMFDVLEALGHAHREGVIHRDVKPENIFLAQNGVETVTKLLDFGISRVIEGGAGITGDRFLGTLHYAAPEQLDGSALTERTDIYAAGCVLFEMLAGRGPFDEEKDPRKIGAAHLKRPAPLLGQFAKVPPELERLVASALEKDPAKRPATALAFAGQLYVLKQKWKNLAVATANTTDESLITAVSLMSPESSGAVKAVSANVTPGSEPARPGVERAPARKLEKAQPTHTADLTPRVPTERLAAKTPAPLARPSPQQSPVEPARLSTGQRQIQNRVRGVIPYALAGASVGLLLVLAFAWMTSPRAHARPEHTEPILEQGR